MTTTLTQQAAAIEATRRILRGGKVKPRGNELELLDQQLADASRTARMFAAHENAIRNLIKATAA
jgi:hypothetical protein